MLRSFTFTTLRRQFLSSTKFRPPIPTVSILFPHTNLTTHRPHSTQKPLLPTVVFSHAYARMARRIPPVRPAIEDSESEPEPDIEEDERNVVGLDSDDDGDESEEWEGFMLDFGELEKLKNEGVGKKE